MNEQEIWDKEVENFFNMTDGEFEELLKMSGFNYVKVEQGHGGIIYDYE